jgi:transposase InsO family protein
VLKTMPWKNTDAAKERVEFVAEALKDEESFATLCKNYGISRPTGYKWISRFEELGPSGLCELSREPHHCPNRLSDKTRDLLLEIKQAHPSWGPKKIHDYLNLKEAESVPAASTIGDLLERHNLVKKRKVRLPVTRELYGIEALVPEKANDVWGVDFKGQFLVGSKYIYPLTVSDLSSRYLLGCEGLPNVQTQGVMACFRNWFDRYGLPIAIRTDNGPPFGTPGSRTTLTQLNRYWIQLGVRLERIIPGRPQQNGVHE